MNDRFLMGAGLVEKLRDTVRTVDGMVSGSSGETVRLTFDEPPNPGVRVRVGDYNGAAWTSNGQQTVTLKNVGVTGYTVAAINLFPEIPATGKTANPCIIAKDGTAWYLVAPQPPGGGAKACRFTGSWSIESDKVVTAISTGETINVTNLIYSIPATDETMKCIIVQEGSDWYLANVKHRGTSVLTRVAVENSSLIFDRAGIQVVGDTSSPTLFALSSCDTYSGSTVTGGSGSSSGQAASYSAMSYFLG